MASRPQITKNLTDLKGAWGWLQSLVGAHLPKRTSDLWESSNNVSARKEFTA